MSRFSPIANGVATPGSSPSYRRRVLCRPLSPATDASQTSFASDLVALIPDLRAMARALSRHSSDAADLVQETCRRAIEARGRFFAGSNLRAWLRRILHNTYVDGYRRAQLEPLAGDGVEHIPAPPPEQASVLALLSPSAVDGALASLPSTQRETYRLFAEERLSYGKIAAQLGVSQNTVGSRIYRARLHLRETLSRQLRNTGVEIESLPVHDAGLPMASAGRRLRPASMAARRALIDSSMSASAGERPPGPPRLPTLAGTEPASPPPYPPSTTRTLVGKVDAVLGAVGASANR